MAAGGSGRMVSTWTMAGTSAQVESPDGADPEAQSHTFDALDGVIFVTLVLRPRLDIPEQNSKQGKWI